MALAVYSEPAQLHKLNWAMHSVKVSMKWEEDNFGREYDLDAFNVACVSDFNAGAMENKGLNIFNCTLLLASMDTSTGHLTCPHEHSTNTVVVARDLATAFTVATAV